MRIEIATAAYNARRYSKPWIAFLTFDGAKPCYDFGDYVGEHGEAGLLVIDAAPGDIIAKGQKDRRGGRTELEYYIVREDGTLALTDKPNAYRHWTERQQSAAEQSAADALKATAGEHLAAARDAAKKLAAQLAADNADQGDIEAAADTIRWIELALRAIRA